MKIAVCLSGLLRGIQACLPSWQKYLLIPDHQFDFFICTGPTLEWNSGTKIADHLACLSKALNVIDIKVEESIKAPYPPLLLCEIVNSAATNIYFPCFTRSKYPTP